MLTKIFTFALLSLGAMVAVGFVLGSVSGMDNTAVVIGSVPISWAKMTVATAIGTVLWIVYKI